MGVYGQRRYAGVEGAHTRRRVCAAGVKTFGECGTHDVLSISGIIYLADVDRDTLAHVEVA